MLTLAWHVKPHKRPNAIELRGQNKAQFKQQLADKEIQFLKNALIFMVKHGIHGKHGRTLCTNKKQIYTFAR